MTDMNEQKSRAATWFHQLRDEIVAAFEALEDSQVSGPLSDAEPGRFEVKPTKRTSDDGSDAGGGLMSVMRGGRVFEKVGVNVSEVFGQLGEQAQKAMAARGVPGMEDDPSFWASGISLVAHMQNPHVPAVHMNTRMFWTPHAWWFGGGSDLNPCIEYDDDTTHFHDQQKAHLDPHGEDIYPALKAWADEYFYIPHRHRARGVGGIFMDDRNTGDWGGGFRPDTGYRPGLPESLRAAGGKAPRTGLERRRQGGAAGAIAGFMPNTTLSTTGAPSSGWPRGMMPMRC